MASLNAVALLIVCGLLAGCGDAFTAAEPDGGIPVQVGDEVLVDAYSAPTTDAAKDDDAADAGDAAVDAGAVDAGQSMVDAARSSDGSTASQLCCVNAARTAGCNKGIWTCGMGSGATSCATAPCSLGSPCVIVTAPDQANGLVSVCP